MGGRSLNWAAVAVLIAVFQIGGTSIMGAAQNGYVMGIAGSWYGIAGFISIGLTALFSSKLRSSFEGDTLSSFLENRYNDRVGKLYSTIYLIMGFFYIPIQLFTLTTIIRMIIPGISLGFAAVIGLLLSITYSSISGIKGASSVGKLTCVIIYISIVVGVIMIVNTVGGMDVLRSELPPEYFKLSAMPLSTILGWFATIFVAFLTMQAGVQPCVSCKRP